MTKFLGIILASIFSVIVIVQVEQVKAQVADSPITGPITSPITAPLTSPTDSPTPTLINTLTSTPTLTATITLTPTVSPSITVTPTPTILVTPTVTVSLTVTPTPSATPTPLPANEIRLSGLDLDGYCAAVGNNWDTVINGGWYCGNGSAKIDMTAACQWQNARVDTIAFQDVPNDVYSWSCYATTPTVTPTPSTGSGPTATPTPTVTITIVPTATLTQGPTVTPTTGSGITATPTVVITAAPTDMPTVTQVPSHNHDGFMFREFSFRALINAVHFFENNSHVNQKEVMPINAKACTNHDNNNNTPKVSAHRTGDAHKDMIVSMRSK